MILHYNLTAMPIKSIANLWKPLILGSCLLSCSLDGLGQKKQPDTQLENQKADALRADQAVEGDETFHTFDRRYKGVKGSPYMLNGWHKANVQTTSKTLTDVPVLYDVLNNNLIVMRAPGDSIVLYPGQVKEFAIDDPISLDGRRTMRRYAFKLNEKVVDSYFEVLAESPQVQLLKLRKKSVKRFNREQNAASYSAQSGYDEIEDNTEYYVYGPDNKAAMVKLNRKSLDNGLGQIGAANRSASGKATAIRTEGELIAAFQQVIKP